MKKLLALIMALMLVVCVFAGCGGGGDDGSSEVILKWAIGQSEQPDTPKVLEEFNKQLANYLPNTKLELILDAQIASKWSLWMAGGTAIDIAHAGYHTDLYSEIAKHSYMPLNDLVKEYGPNIETERSMYGVEYGGGTYNGELYAIPNVQYHVNNSFFINIPYELKDYFPVEEVVKEAYSSRKTTAKMYELFDQYFTEVYSKKKVDTQTISAIIDVNRMLDMAKRGYDFIGGMNSNLCYDPDKEDYKIIDFHTTEEFKTFIDWAYKWYQKGYISKDILTGAGSGSRLYVIQTTWGNRGFLEDGADTYKVENDKSIVTTGVDRLYIQMNKVENDYLGASELGKISTYTSIPSTSKNPERAMKFLNILHSEEGRDLMNLLCYGFEGTHYDVVDADKNYITPYEYAGQGNASCKYGIPNWIIGNIFFADVCHPLYDENYVNHAVEYYKNREANAYKTKLYNFSANIDGVTNELAQLTAVNLEYETQLKSGALTDVKATYDQMLSKCEAAGQSKIIAELQKQVDEYIKG